MTETDEYDEATLADSVFKMNGTKDAKSTFQTVAIIQTKNSKIQFTANWVGGMENAGYGLFWGYKDVDNHYQFAISADGSFILLKYNNWQNKPSFLLGLSRRQS